MFRQIIPKTFGAGRGAFAALWDNIVPHNFEDGPHVGARARWPGQPASHTQCMQTMVVRELFDSVERLLRSPTVTFMCERAVLLSRSCAEHAITSWRPKPHPEQQKSGPQ